MYKPAVLFMVLCVVLSLSCTEKTEPPHAIDTTGAQRREASGDETKAEDRKRPNVVWILFDALRAENLSCYGYERPTSPIMDRLAAEGVLFEQHYTQGLWTAISVPSYMTGRYFPVLVHEPLQAKEAIREIPKGERLAPEIFKANGYQTTFITAHSWFTPKSRLWKAFDEAIHVPPWENAKLPQARFKKVNGAVFEWLEKPRDKPFFLYIHLLDTHFPHIPTPPHDRWIPEDYSGTAVKNGTPVKKYDSQFTEADREYLRGMYDGSIQYTDTQLGVLLDKMEQLGLRENTVFVLASDHGDMLGEDGTTWGHVPESRDWIMQVPLILAGPGLPKGRRVSTLTENADIVPGLVELLGLKTDAETDGQSFVPMLTGDNPKFAQRVVFSKYVRGGYDGAPTVILRSAGYKYEFDVERGSEKLWRMPDSEFRRVDCIDEEPEVVERMRRFARTKVLPQWEAYSALPTSAIYLSLNNSMKWAASPKEAFVLHPHDKVVEARTDGKWGYDETWRRLWTRGWQEEVPPLQFEYRVPNGRFLLQVELYSNRDHYGYPASAVQIRAEDDSEFKKIVYDRMPPEEKGWFFVDVGEYNITDEKLNLTLKGGGPEHWSLVRAFRLLATLDSESDAQADADRAAQLEALGYLQ